MSLKSFHIFFILCSILLSGFFAFWQYQNSTPVPAIASAAVTLSLFVYLFWFLKKMKKGTAV